MLKPKKILLLGSGALKIGEAGEFDYSGSQAIKAYKEEKIKVILVNPNIATNQTSKGLADKVYFLPVTLEFVTRIIEKEKPDAIALSFGGQTALNCGLALEKSGILKKFGIHVLGTPTKSIEITEDRELFNKTLQSIDVRVPKSIACTSVQQAQNAANKLGFPVIVRAAFALGGKGSGFAYNKEDLQELLEKAFSESPQVLVEENLKGWKEVEYEVVRDCADNCITVCNMENVDPLGIHTGESIVVAPSQTLTNKEYHKLRELALKVIRHLGIVGECNIQYALDPVSEDYRVIEVNARLSRSSALASKATGYPLAYVAAKLGLNYKLTEIKNSVTKKTCACFEPALDYLVMKIPRWDLQKFKRVDWEIGTEMKSVGEVMAIGRSFEEVLQKALRMLQIGAYGFTARTFEFKNLERIIQYPTPRRIFAIAAAFEKGWSVEKINKLSGIDNFFLEKMKNIMDFKKELKALRGNFSEKSNQPKLATTLRRAKELGFSDAQIARYIKDIKTCHVPVAEEINIRTIREKLGILPVIKRIDTLAAEFPSQTNYLYFTYNATQSENQKLKNKKQKAAIVLGSGAYCIGSSVEFDWCCVNAIKALKKEGYKTIMLNYNPETVSTDYDECDKLYFDELSLERVLDVLKYEGALPVVVSMGGQIPNNLVNKLKLVGVKILGTKAEDIDRAEDRHKFSQLLDDLKIDQPKWRELTKVADALDFAQKVNYPVLVRPSYVLSGAAMSVAYNQEQLKNYLDKATTLSPEAPVVISKFEEHAKEIEIDAVAHKGELIIWAIAEHIESAGVHSGDATIVLPPQKLYLETVKSIRAITKRIAHGLNITGPFNIQFLAKNNQIKVIECNLRASRSFPFSSKVTGHNFVEIAIRAMLGKVESREWRKKNFRTLDLDHVAVKAAQFSFSRLKGADPVMGVEMASTGEVACFGEDLHEAFLKSILSVGFKLPKKNIFVSAGNIQSKADFLASAKDLIRMGYKLFASEGTAQFLKENDVSNAMLHWPLDKDKKPNVIDYMLENKIDLVINIPKSYAREELTNGYLIRRKATDLGIPLITNLQIAKVLIDALEKYKLGDLPIKSWEEYV